MSAQSLRTKMAHMFEITGFLKMSEMMVESQEQMLSKIMSPELVAKFKAQMKERLGERFMNRAMSMMIEAGMDEGSVDAAIAFYSGPGAKFMAFCQNPEFIQNMAQIAEQEAKAAIEFVRKEMGEHQA